MKMCTFMIIYCLILVRMRNVSEKVCTENQHTLVNFNNVFRNRAIYEAMWKNMAQSDMPQMTV